jgi:hypothetical protein
MHLSALMMAAERRKKASAEEARRKESRRAEDEVAAAEVRRPLGRKRAKALWIEAAEKEALKKSREGERVRKKRWAWA